MFSLCASIYKYNMEGRRRTNKFEDQKMDHAKSKERMQHVGLVRTLKHFHDCNCWGHWKILTCYEGFQSNTLVKTPPITNSFLPCLAHNHNSFSPIWDREDPDGHTSESEQGQDRTNKDCLPWSFTATHFWALLSVENMTLHFPWRLEAFQHCTQCLVNSLPLTSKAVILLCLYFNV